MIRLLAALLAALLVCSPAAAQSAHDLLVGETKDINPRYLLQDINGRSVTNEDFRGRFQLIAFGYTYCPDICPTTLVEMAAILKQLGDQADRCSRSSSPSTPSATPHLISRTISRISICASRRWCRRRAETKAMANAATTLSKRVSLPILNTGK